MPPRHKGLPALSALAAVGALHGWPSLPWMMNAAAAAVCSLQQAAGSAIVAASLIGSNRYALLFSTNTLLANGAAALLGNVGARIGFSTNAYYVAVACAQLVLVGISPLFSVRDGEAPPKLDEAQPDEPGAGLSADCVVLHEHVVEEDTY